MSRMIINKRTEYQHRNQNISCTVFELNMTESIHPQRFHKQFILICARCSAARFVIFSGGYINRKLGSRNTDNADML